MNFKDYIDGNIAAIYSNSKIETIRNSAFMSTSIQSVYFDNVTMIGICTFSGCRQLKSAIFPECRFIYGSAFAYCTSLTNINFPECLRINNYAFYNDTSLIEANFPECTMIGSNAFSGCTSLQTISFPKCQTIGSNAFAMCTKLSSIKMNEVVSVFASAFARCSKLLSIELPKCYSVGVQAFQSCSSLTTVNIKNVSYIGASAFMGCSSIKQLSLNQCATIATSAFCNCYSLSKIQLSYCSSILSGAFYSCFRLLSFAILGPSVCALSSYVFTGTPIGGRTTSTGGVYGSIYVPLSLYDKYIAAKNWSTYSKRIVGCEELSVPQGITSSGDTNISWDAVTDATSYNIYIDGDFDISTSELSHDIQNDAVWTAKTAGNHTVTVTATAAAHFESAQSDGVIVVKAS